MADYRDRYEAACIVIDEAREENEKLRAENQALREALGKIKRVLGPSSPSCDGCATELGEALKIIDGVEI